MTTMAHVHKWCGQLSGTIHDIACKHNILSRDTTKIIMQSLILSRLDYCNSQLTGSSKKDIQKLQHTQNMACRVIFNLCKYDSVTPHLISLHCLKVEFRVIFKLAIIIYTCAEGTAPGYMIEMVVKHRKTRVLWSATANKLTTKNNLIQVQLSSFALIGPYIWNSLPQDITNANFIITFKKHLKTFLFTQCYY